ncbi:MAG: DJ-1/PfpI family protein [Prevotellaceae bacterium]|nr:DJ-1/PfpI family protein [Prevotellaceae bacterium]
MAKVYEFMANGTEELEALTVVDVLRRGGVDIKTVSISGTEEIESSHGVVIKCDMRIEDACLDDADMLLLPGGLPGSTHLLEHEGVREALLRHAAEGRRIGAICAAPMVLGDLGLLKGRKATCYPGFEKYMDGAEYTEELYTVDGNIITGCGPAATLPYSYAILEMLTDKDTVERLKEGMMYNRLVSRL